MKHSFDSLLRLLNEVSDEFHELRDGVQKAIQLASIDPEMSLTRARKILEHVIRDIYCRSLDQPPGTRPLENLLQDLTKHGHLPARVNAYASAVRMLGNVGTHGFGEAVSSADVYLALTQLLPVLDWYFAQIQGVSGGAGDDGLRASLGLRPSQDSRRIRDWLNPRQQRSPPEGHHVTIDTTPVLAERGGEHTMDCREYPSVSALLADIWYLLASAVEPHTYGKCWILREQGTYRVFDVGSSWALSNHVSADDRPLVESGIMPGMKLETVPLP